MYVLRGTAKNRLPKIFENWRVTTITYEIEIEPFNRRRDFLAKVIADKHNVKIEEFHSHTVYNPYVVLQRNNSEVPMQMQKFLLLVERMHVPEPEELESMDFLEAHGKPEPDEDELENENFYDVPALDEWDVDESQMEPTKYAGGEDVGLKRLDDSMRDTKWVCEFEKPKTAPNSIRPSTTVLSPYLTFGCLSSRLFHQRLSEVLRQGKKYSKPPVSLMGQLMWREFYYTAAAAEDNFDKMVGNSLCRQIPWNRDKRLLDAWAYGRTGYPFIDAIMRQLRQEGWIHHLARHAVACFLTRGDLWQSWEDGQRVFEELLLDADWALNAGNWMWLSASAFFYQYFRVYSPVAFGKKTDPRGDFIRKYCPELKHFPSDMIYEPWKASRGEQKQYKCTIGKDYPERIVIHENVIGENKGRMAKAYKIHNDAKTPLDRALVPRPKTEVKAETSRAASQSSDSDDDDSDDQNVC